MKARIALVSIVGFLSFSSGGFLWQHHGHHTSRIRHTTNTTFPPKTTTTSTVPVGLNPTTTTAVPEVPPVPSDPLLDQSSYVRGVFACIRTRESKTEPTVVNARSGDGGLYQFNVTTWLAHGGGQFAPNAQSATVIEQDTVAVWTWETAGFSPWTGDNSCGF